jgi:hypothetical protein
MIGGSKVLPDSVFGSLDDVEMMELSISGKNHPE